MIFDSTQFIDQGDVLVQEMSTLGIPPGQSPLQKLTYDDVGIVVQYPTNIVEFKFIGLDTSNEDVAGFRFISRAGKRLLIIND